MPPRDSRGDDDVVKRLQDDAEWSNYTNTHFRPRGPYARFRLRHNDRNVLLLILLLVGIAVGCYLVLWGLAWFLQL